MKMNLLSIVCIVLFIGLNGYILRADEQVPFPQVIVVENDWPPYFFGETHEQLPGFARELLQKCIPSAGYVAKFQFYPLKRMYSYLQSGEIDIALFSHKADRDSFVLYGRESLFSSGYRPVIRSETDIRIDSLDDFDALRLGHLAGLKYSPSFLEYIDRRQKAGSLITTTTGDSALRMLLEGIIDVFVDTQDTVLWRAKKMGVLNRIKIVDYDIKSSDYFMAVAKKTKRIQAPQEFLDTFDRCLAEMKKNGEYTDIAKKYTIQAGRP
ncbi:ABC transporter substrate-binding protein [Desulfopila sp. IMCC35006]|uniref:substrate-binding periplasmic protein n=1 Tax=Desulfopila sp. IMCC35006 TaxID=2569542 RepID=UPI00142EE46D|nr:transporter substrate-binding domain-containing protein [Desulfopila sp. IMCC35006]